MRIEKIIVENLTTLRDEHTLDLQDVKDDLFLLYGPTGSGKSTLLDAISLALFGRTARLSSDAANVSDSNTSDHPVNLMSTGTGKCSAHVELTSESGPRGAGRYRIGWKMHRAGKRPEGNPQSAEYEVLWLEDDDKETDLYRGSKKEDRQKLVDQILGGLDYEQFSRSIVLFQNEFASFLEAPAEEKSRLISSLSGASRYAALGRFITQEHKRIKERLDELTKKTEGWLEPDEVTALKERLETIQADIGRLDEERDELMGRKNDLEARQERLDALEGAREELTQAEEAATLTSAEREALETDRRCRDAEGALDKLDSMRQAHEEDHQVHEEAQAALEDAGGEATEEEVEQARAAKRDLEERLEALQHAEEARDEARDALSELEHELEMTAEKRQRAQEELEAVSAEQFGTRERVHIYLRQSAPLFLDAGRGASLRGTHDEALEMLEARAESGLGEEPQTEELLSLHDHVVDGLEKDEYLDEDLRARLEEAKNRLSQANVEVAQLHEKIAEARQDLQKREAALERASQAIDDDEELEALASELEALERRLELTRKLERARQDEQSARERLEARQEALDSELRRLELDDEEALRALLLDPKERERLEALARKSEAVEARVKDAREAREAAQQRLEVWEREHPELEALDAEALDADLEQTQAQIQAHEERLEARRTERHEARAQLEAHEDVDPAQIEELEALHGQHTHLHTLHKLLGEKSDGEVRFETHAQAYNLRALIKRANENLGWMSDDRYHLEPLEDAEGVLKADFRLHDAYSERARPLATLSGGERFQVSLCLALALADIHSRHTSIETLFIDEGFGALDQESLVHAVKTLEKLRDERTQDHRPDQSRRPASRGDRGHHRGQAPARRHLQNHPPHRVSPAPPVSSSRRDLPKVSAPPIAHAPQDVPGGDRFASSMKADRHGSLCDACRDPHPDRADTTPRAPPRSPLGAGPDPDVRRGPLAARASVLARGPARARAARAPRGARLARGALSTGRARAARPARAVSVAARARVPRDGDPLRRAPRGDPRGSPPRGPPGGRASRALRARTRPHAAASRRPPHGVDVP